MVFIKKIQLTLDEHSRFCKVACETAIDNGKKGNSLVNIALWAIATFILMALYDYLFNDSVRENFHWPTAGFVIVIFSILLIAYFWELRKNHTSMQPDKDGIMFCARESRVDEVGIFTKSKYDETLIFWSAVKNIIEDEGAVYLFIDTFTAEIFPANCFNTDEERKQLLTFARQCSGTYMSS